MVKVSGQRKIYEIINERIIDLLEKGEIPWRKPWVSGDPVNFTMGSVNITELEFTEDTLHMLLTTGNGTQTIPYTYSVDGDQLILSFQFTGERPSWRPPLNDSERPPFDRERPFDGESPFNGERPSMTRSYTYSFYENNTILYLDGSEFIKIR